MSNQKGPFFSSRRVIGDNAEDGITPFVQNHVTNFNFWKTHINQTLKLGKDEVWKREKLGKGAIF